jgi:hypothetical protein
MYLKQHEIIKQIGANDSVRWQKFNSVMNPRDLLKKKKKNFVANYGSTDLEGTCCIMKLACCD